MTTDLHPCPKCHAPMRTIERSGIHIESCPDCRGIFLDRGELDRLLDLEAATLARRPAPTGGPGTPIEPPLAAPAGGYPDQRWSQPPSPAPSWDRLRRDWDDDDDDDRDERRGWDRDRDDRYDRDDRSDRGRRRRGGFLSDLLEGFGD